MLRITSIGSCRVAGPLQMSQERLGYVVNKSRSYGYCHSSGEAVQLAKFLRGEFDPSAHVWPLIARGVAYQTVAQQTHDLSDIYIVELSSAKRITFGDVFLQLNYLTNAFSDVLGDPQSARDYWNVVTTENQDLIDEHLAKVVSTKGQIDVLRHVRLSVTTPDQLASDMHELQDMLPNVLFVTHVNALNANGAALSSRADFIDMVKTVARQQGARCYNPTRAMHEMGQALAMSDHRTGLAHFTDSFAHEIANDWDQHIIKPVLRDQSDASLIIPHLKARLSRGALGDVVPRCTEFGGKLPATLQAEIDIAFEDANSTFERLKRRTDPENLFLFIKAAFALKRYDDVAAAFRQMIDLPSSRQVWRMARTALDAGNLVAAISLLETLLKFVPTHALAAIQLADILLAHDELPSTDIGPETRARVLENVDLRTRLQLSDMNGWDHDIEPAHLDQDDLVEAVAYLTFKDDVKEATALLLQWRVAHKQSIPDGILPIVDRWCAIIPRLNDDVSRIQTLKCVLTVFPKHTVAKDLLRDIRRDLRHTMRAAAKRSDRAALSALIAPNAALPAPLKELNLYRARERFDAGAFDDAAKIGLQAAIDMPTTISVWVLLMRAAKRQGKAVQLQEFAMKVLALSDADTSRLRAEAKSNLALLEPSVTESAT